MDVEVDGRLSAAADAVRPEDVSRDPFVIEEGLVEGKIGGQEPADSFGYKGIRTGDEPLPASDVTEIVGGVIASERLR
jgi:hypothetical protein